MTTICETVTVTVKDEKNEQRSFVLPAFTVTPSALEMRVADLLGEYTRRSIATANQTSLADFALYLINEASDDPREMP